MDVFLTLDDVATTLKISRRTVRNLIKQGRLRAVNVAGEKNITYRVLQKELDRFVAENYKNFTD